MKRTFRLLLLCTTVFMLSACENIFNPGRDVTIIAMDGSKQTIHYKDSFSYEPTEIDGYYYMGCYEYRNLKSKKYINYDGKMVYNGSEIPEIIYEVYIPQNGPQVIDFDFRDVDISSSRTSATYTLALDSGYSHYFENKDVSAYVNFSFVHYAKEEGVSGVNTFNWLTYTLQASGQKIDNGTLRSNNDYTTFDRMYLLDKKQVFSNVTLNLARPSECISTAAAKIKSITAMVYFGTLEDIAPYKYKNLVTSPTQSRVNITFEDNSTTINDSYSTSTNMNYNFPFNLIDWIGETTTPYITFELDVFSYGRKLLLFSNWCEGSFVLSNDYRTSIHLERNNSGELDTFSIKVPTEAAKLFTKAEAKFNHPDGNASSMFYYIWGVSLSISRTN